MADTLIGDDSTVPDADEEFIRTHLDEILGLAAKYGIRHVKYASRNRLVGVVEDASIVLPTYTFMAVVERELGRKLCLFSQTFADLQSRSSDLAQARPL